MGTPTIIPGNPIAVPGGDVPIKPIRLSKTLSTGMSSVLAWSPTAKAMRGVHSWYQLREWNSVGTAPVCGSDQFQSAIRSRAQEAKQLTDSMPMGLKTILVFWELTPHYDDPRDAVKNRAGVVQGYTDARGVFNPYPSPWWDHATLESRCRIESFFQEFKRIGGSVDYVVLDTERTMSNWQIDNFARERLGANSSMVGAQTAEARRLDYFRAIDNDPRMDHTDNAEFGFKISTPLRNQLTLGTLSEHVSKWWYPEVKTGPGRLAYLQWNQLMADRAATYLNYAVSNPIRELFPKIKISNYDNQFTSAAHNLPDGFGHQVGLFPHREITGNVQSKPMYGVLRDLTYLYVKSPFLAFQGTAFNALVQNLNWLRSGVLSRPDVAFQGWIAPKSWGTPHGCTECRLYENSMYEEMLYHTLLSTTEPLLFWNPPGVSTPQAEAALVSAVNEYDRVMGYAKKRTPQVSALIDWQADYILSSEESDTQTVYRFTPRLPATQSVLSLVRSYQPAIVMTPSGRRMSFGGGYIAPSPPKSAGLWIVVPKPSASAAKKVSAQRLVATRKG
ncbi:MAG: hypothetical protein EBZ48_07385 [Proteobacteria bacterium]|nr:hypothetical protein [Pseudomonadota bacterium]